MKTTIYELIGMIKDNKAPKRILWKDEVFVNVGKDYADNDNDYLFIDYEWQDMLNDEVEILETTITYKPDKIEKIEESVGVNTYDLGLDICNIKNKINEIIDKVNNL